MAERKVKIRFYAGLKRRVVDPAWPGGTIPAGWLLQGATQHYDPVANEVAKSSYLGLEGLTYGTDGSAYIRDPTVPEDEPDPDIYFGVVQHKTTELVHLRMWRVRMSQLPALHDLQDGSTVPITLTKTQGLAEASDFVLFVKSCVVGHLVNRAGPSQAQTMSYLATQTGVNMKLAPLHRSDALELVRGDLVTAVDVEVATGHFEALANVTEEIGQAATAVRTPGLKTIRVAFSAERDERGQFWDWWKPKARRLAGLGREQLQRLDVTQAGDDELSSQTVDLLAQIIGLEATVDLETGRTVEADAARQAVLDGYRVHLERIQEAADGLDARAENMRTERKKRKRSRLGTADTLGS